jgi:hypothetical protein
MPWAKIDDQLHANEKFASVSLAAVGLWTICLAWSISNNTDGWIDGDIVDSYVDIKDFDGQNHLAEELTLVALWERTKSGHYQFLDTSFFKIQTGPSYEYRTFKDEVFERDGYACVYCSSPLNLSLDHVTPQSKGGGHSPDNLVTCCRSCNSSKGAKSIAEWKGEDYVLA